jgi:ankyrin repeat protein
VARIKEIKEQKKKKKEEKKKRTDVMFFLLSSDLVNLLSLGASLLHVACQYGNQDVVQVLLKDQAVDVNQPLQDSNLTPLFLACRHGHKQTVTLLLQNDRIDVNKPMKSGATPLYTACQNNLTEIVALLLKNDHVDVNESTNSGSTPFQIACESGHVAVVALLLADPRVDTNRPKNDGCTPLWFAAQNGHLTVAQHILASGRAIDTEKRSQESNASWSNKTASEAGRRQPLVSRYSDEKDESYQRRITNGPIIADLIDAYEQDPPTVREQLRLQLGFKGVFCFVLFSSSSFGADGCFLALLSEIVQAMHSYIANRPTELSFAVRDIMVVTKKDPSGWWEAELANGKKGSIPCTYVKEYSSPPVPLPSFSSSSSSASVFGVPSLNSQSNPCL